MTLNHRIVSCGLLLILAGPSPSLAQSAGFTEQDFASLPNYCFVRTRGDEAAKRNMSQQLGAEQFLHVHHYCFGLHFMNKAVTTFDKRKKNELLGRANGEFGYVIQHMPPSAPLRANAIQYQQQIKMMIQR